MSNSCGYCVYLLAKDIERLQHRDALIILPNKYDLCAVQDGLKFFAPGKHIIVLPQWDCMPNEATSSPSADVTAARIAAIGDMLSDGPKVVVTNQYAASQLMPPSEYIGELSFLSECGKTTRADLLKFLHKTGYYACDIASNAGEFAERASIIDVVSGQDAFRFDFNCDVVESIRVFDMHTQASIGRAGGAKIYSASEVIDVGRCAHDGDIVREFTQNNVRKQGLERHLHSIYGSSSCVCDYLREPKVFVVDHDSIKSDFIYKVLCASNTSSSLHIAPSEIERLLDDGSANLMKAVTSFGVEPIRDFHAEAVRAGSTSSFAIIKNELEAGSEFMGKRVLVCCGSSGACSRVAGALSAYGLRISNVENIGLVHSDDGIIHVARAPIDEGFSVDGYYIISEKELFGHVAMAKARHYRSAKKSQLLLSAFNGGDIVVHENYGIGKFLGLQSIIVDGKTRDCIAIEYAESSKLMIPVENINLITRYGRASDDGHIMLDKLGGTGWQNRKARLKRKIYEISKSLIDIAARRKEHRTAPMVVNVDEFDRFCASFPYVETDDQERAIRDVIDDLTGGMLMDRLICGEAGFGKTEVAMRAAYIVTHDLVAGGQVAVLTPSTLLCEQHLGVFRSRLGQSGCIVEQVSRMNTAKQHKDIKARVESGKVDIIIGTHALLSDSMKFKNLRMLIIDEEQSFGVKQKEKLKAAHPGIHVLSLSATPIPRTLYMSLAGIRDMSVIATPPINKADVETMINEYDDQVVVNAVMREVHRRGQVFYVCPKIQQLNKAVEHLVTLFPTLKIAKAHGQMQPEELSAAMSLFYNGKCDILVSTTVVESGLNIPNANTIIVENAQHLGVSQLCQLRGRVGRHKARGYAYIMLPPAMSDAEKTWHRVSILKSVNSGFAIATHDMDERGFGNVLGSEQSGAVKEVGIELYQKMLEDAIGDLRNNNAERINPEVNLGLAVAIPREYVADDDARLLLYRKAAEIDTVEQIEEFAMDLIDRFGALPLETANLLKTLKYKIVCRSMMISKVNVRDSQVIISFFNNTFANPDGLMSLVSANRLSMKITPQQELSVRIFGDEIGAEVLDRCLGAVARLA